MSEEVDFDWPSFNTVLDDVAASRGINRVLSPQVALTDDLDTIELDPDARPTAIRSELVEPLSLPEPLEPLNLDTSRVRRLLDERTDSDDTVDDDIEISALSELAEPAEIEIGETEQEIKAQLIAETEELQAQLKAEAEELEAQLKADAEELEAQLKADAEELEAQLKAEAEAEAEALEAQLKAEAEALEADTTETQFDDEISIDPIDDIAWPSEDDPLESEDVEDTADGEAEAPETELESAIRELQTGTDELETETTDTDPIADITWPSEHDNLDNELIDWEEAGFDSNETVDLFDVPDEQTEVIPDLENATEDSDALFDSWDEISASNGEATEPAETALVFDMSDDDILQHEASAGVTPLEEVFVTEEPSTDRFAEHLELDLAPVEASDSAAGLQDDNVVNLFDTTPDWDSGFDSIEVANEIEHDLFDLGAASENVIPISDKGDDHLGLPAGADSFEFMGFEDAAGTGWSEPEDSSDEPKWRTLDEEQPVLEAGDDAPTSDPWEYMRPAEEANSGGWWANRPRFLGGTGKASADAPVPPVEVPGLSYDAACPSCGEEGVCEKEDQMAREVHLACSSCENEWSTHYEIDAKAS